MHFFTTVAITVVLLLCNCDSEFIYSLKLLFFNPGAVCYAQWIILNEITKFGNRSINNRA